MAKREAAAEMVQTDSLVPWEGNPRRNEAAVAEVARSIERFGFAEPIVARRANREIIAGHTRWFAAKRLGLARVPVRLLDLSEREARALALASNRLGEIAEWDDDALALVLASLRAESVDLSGLGWDDAELARLIPQEIDVDGHIRNAQTNGGTEETLGGLEFRVIVDCDGEIQQVKLIERLQQEGFACRALMS